MYAFPNIKETGLSSNQFARKCLNEAGVALLYGNCFSRYGEGYVRGCFVNSTKIIEDALNRLEVFLNKDFIPLNENSNFGASSAISKDLIINFTKYNPDFKLHLFGRNKGVLEEWLKSNNILKNIQTINEYEVLDKKFDVVINFIGIGDSTKLKNLVKILFQLQINMMIL